MIDRAIQLSVFDFSDFHEIKRQKVHEFLGMHDFKSVASVLHIFTKLVVIPIYFETFSLDFYENTNILNGNFLYTWCVRCILLVIARDFQMYDKNGIFIRW